MIIAGHPEPTHTMDLAKDSVGAGVASLQAHKEYLAVLPDHPKPEEFIPEFLEVEGGYAAAFRVFGR